MTVIVSKNRGKPRSCKKPYGPRQSGSRKGDNGTVLIVGGNKIYHGAPILASLAALRSGTDLVHGSAKVQFCIYKGLLPKFDRTTYVR